MMRFASIHELPRSSLLGNRASGVWGSRKLESFEGMKRAGAYHGLGPLLSVNLSATVAQVLTDKGVRRG
jgi:hypothetical protein